MAEDNTERPPLVVVRKERGQGRRVEEVEPVRPPDAAPAGPPDPSAMPFLAALNEADRIATQDELTDADRHRIALLDQRLGELIDRVEQRGGLRVVYEVHTPFVEWYESLQQNEKLSAEEKVRFITQARLQQDDARRLTNDEEKEDVRGVREYVLRDAMGRLINEASQLTTAGPEVAQNTKRAPEDMTFLEARSARAELVAKRGREGLNAEEQARLAQVNTRMSNLMAEVEAAGNFEDLRPVVDAFARRVRDYEDHGPTAEQKAALVAELVRSITGAPNITAVEDVDDVYRGVRENLFANRVGRLLERANRIAGREAEAVQDNEGLTEALRELAVALGREGRGTLRDILPPGDKEGQLAVIRPLLEEIEDSNRQTEDITIGPKVSALETALKFMHEEVASEVRARIAVHDASELMKRANGWIERPQFAGFGLSIGGAANQANERNHALDRNVVEMFLRNGMDYLDTATAWDLLQDANFDYPEMIRRANDAFGTNFEEVARTFMDDEVELGVELANYYTDPNPQRKAAVRRLMVEELGGNEDADRAVKLAEKLAIATLETSVFNRSALTGNDELAEIIGLKGWRTRRAEPGRNRGPRIHERSIEGFGTSWLRTNTENGNVKRPIYAEDVRINRVKEGHWMFHCSVAVSRYHNLRKLILDRAPKPEFDKNFLQSAVVYFNTADKPAEGKKNGPKSLRTYWVLGVVDIALAEEALGWNAKNFADFARTLTREELSPGAGTFITPEQWKWVEEKTRLKSRMRNMGLYRSLTQFGEAAFKVK